MDTEQVKWVKRLYSVLAVGLIIMGAFLLFKPGVATDLLCRITGGMLILFGTVKLFGYFSRDLLQLAFQHDFTLGITSCVIGLIMLIWATKLIEVMIAVLGLLLLVDALLRIQTAMDAKKIGVEKWQYILGVALVIAVIGVLLVIRPILGTRAAIMLVGLNLMIDGILNLLVVRKTVTILRSEIRRNETWNI